MSGLIRREDAIEAVENNSYGMGSRASVKAIKVLPSAEPKTGEWVKREKVGLDENDIESLLYYWYECSECGHKPPCDSFRNEWHSSYCPSCGARMKGESYE